MKILTCVGTRPNFIKVTRLEECFKQIENVDYRLLHTGQHFDKNMSQIFFDELSLKKPDYFLGAKGNTQMEVISNIILKFEPILKEFKPDWVLVPGDVNSTLACALTANRNNIKIAHIESGLRSFDKKMPEEINRILVDSISDLLLVSEKSGLDNLKTENKPQNSIRYVGNTMIDSLVKFMPKINSSNILGSLNVKSSYGLITLHRPSNVDDSEKLKDITEMLNAIADKVPLIFPIHPRTLKNINTAKLHKNIVISPPLGYIDFLHALSKAKFILTDSGGIQEESTFLKVPCLTLRNNTERPSTITQGTNELVTLKSNLPNKVDDILNGKWKRGQIPKYWDGFASERIVESVVNYN